MAGDRGAEAGGGTAALLEMVAGVRPELRSLTIVRGVNLNLMAVLGPRLHRFTQLEHLSLEDFTGETGEAARLVFPTPSYLLKRLDVLPAVVLAIDDDGVDELGEYGQDDVAWFLGDSRHSLRHLSLTYTSSTVLPTADTWASRLSTLTMEFAEHAHDKSCLPAHRLAAAKVLPAARFRAALTERWPFGPPGRGGGSEAAGAWGPGEAAGAWGPGEADSEDGIGWTGEGEDMHDLPTEAPRAEPSSSSDSGDSMADDGPPDQPPTRWLDFARWDAYRAQDDGCAQASDDDSGEGSDWGDDEDFTGSLLGVAEAEAWAEGEDSDEEGEDWTTWPAGVNACADHTEEYWLARNDVGW